MAMAMAMAMAWGRHEPLKKASCDRVVFGLRRHGILISRAVDRGWPISRAVDRCGLAIFLNFGPEASPTECGQECQVPFYSRGRPADRPSDRLTDPRFRGGIADEGMRHPNIIDLSLSSMMLGWRMLLMLLLAGRALDRSSGQL